MQVFLHIERFTLVYRAMHVLLILSFFTLVTTGFPLKYYNAPWAKTLMAERKLEGLKRRHPGIPLKLVSAAIGFISLLLGMALTALFIWVIMKVE